MTSKAEFDEMVAVVQAGINKLSTIAKQEDFSYSLQVKSNYYDTDYIAHVEASGRGTVDAWVSSNYVDTSWESSDC